MRDAVGRFQTVAVLGGGSEIARATLLELLHEGPFTAVLAARRPDQLDADEFERNGATVERAEFDARSLESHPAAIGEIFDRNGDVDLVLLAFGLLGSQADAERDAAAAVAVAETNFVGAVSALTLVVERLRAQGHGTVVVLSSVAAVRARRSNYVYGAAKAGLDAFAQGIQLTLRGSGVRLLLVRPGFVRTRMTAGMRPPPLSVTPEAVGAAIVAGLRPGGDVVWVPPAMRAVAWVLRLLPARVLESL